MHCFPFPSQDCHVLLLWLIRTPQFPMVSQRKWFTNKCCLLNLLYQKTCTCATWFDMFAKQYVISYVVIYIYLSIYSKILKVFCQTLPQEKCRSHGHLRQHRFHQETQLLSVVRRHLSLVLESLSPQLRIFDIYMCIRLMQ